MTLKQYDEFYFADYHVHTSLSFDGRGTVDDLCRKAIEAGLREIGFSEHVGIDPSDDAYGSLDYGHYRHLVEDARGRYAKDISVKLGIEIDFRSCVLEETGQYLDSHEFDYVIGGVHYLDNEIILKTDIFEGRPCRDVWEHYFNEVYLMAESGLFDIIAHLDVAKRGYVPLHGAFEWTAYEDSIADILKEIINRGASLEINTAGLRKQANELLPGAGILKLYKRLGGRLVTLGSDAHSPDKVGCDFDAALAAMDEAGLTQTATYSGRKPKLVPVRV